MVVKPLTIVITGQPVPEAERRRGDFSRMIREACDGSWDGPWRTIDLRTANDLPPPSDSAAVVVSGSPARLSEQSAWMRKGLEYLRLLVAAETPVLGICFGHQMLGEALGGKVAENPNGREIGTVAVTRHSDNPLLEPDQPFTANATHLDSVVELPQGAEVFASTVLEPNAVVRFARRAWGVQFHPEMDADIVREYVLARRDTIEEEGVSVDALLGGLEDALAGRRVLQNFVRRIVLA